MQVFFSHSSRDKALIRELRGHFPPWLATWIDEDRLLFGVDLEPSLRQVIDVEVDFVVLFLSKEAIESDWVKREIAWALEREDYLGRVFILPILLSDVRDRVDEVGLEGRLTLEIADYSRDGTKMLADKLTSHLGGWLSELAAGQSAGAWSAQRGPKPSDEFLALTQLIVSGLTRIPDDWRPDVEQFLIRPFLQQIASSQIGEIPLTSAQYYHRILNAMVQAGVGSRILAVSTLTSDLWNDDLDQFRYAVRNLEAIQRGAEIRRLFVIPEGREASFRPSIEGQASAGIHVRIAGPAVLAHAPDLEDFVLFDGPSGRQSYISHPTIDGSRRIRSGRLMRSENALSSLTSAFENAWEIALERDEFYRRVDSNSRSGFPRPGTAPGLTLEARFLGAPVISCEEAARARGIPLVAEMKTLILKTHSGLVAAHLPGDGILSLRKVKDRLETPEAYLADPEDLLELELSAGTVSAVLEPVWGMPHLVSRRLLNLPEVMTNNGTRLGYFAFDPAVLTQAANVVVGDFEK